MNIGRMKKRFSKEATVVEKFSSLDARLEQIMVKNESGFRVRKNEKERERVRERASDKTGLVKQRKGELKKDVEM